MERGGRVTIVTAGIRAQGEGGMGHWHSLPGCRTHPMLIGWQHGNAHLPSGAQTATTCPTLWLCSRWARPRCPVCARPSSAGQEEGLRAACMQAQPGPLGAFPHATTTSPESRGLEGKAASRGPASTLLLGFCRCLGPSGGSQHPAPAQPAWLLFSILCIFQGGPPSLLTGLCPQACRSGRGQGSFALEASVPPGGCS